MKNIYFVQVGFDFDGSVYLPTAAGAITAFCLKDAYIKSNYSFPDIIFKREKLSDCEQKIKEPYIVAFSCSVWNMEYNLALAKLIKGKYPECLIVFGGHNVEDSTALLEQHPFIDILIYGEGEEPFCSLLYALEKGKPGEAENIAFRENDSLCKTERKYYNDISFYPSPYLSGVFDKIMEQNPDTDFLTALETTRGCPYSCAYCDWCAGKKTRFFPMEKVLAEIRWLAEKKIEYCFCADSNFGMFERDVEIAEALVQAKRKYGYPKVFRPCYEKNSDERVFEICRILNSEGMDKGATMAYQTLSDRALENIGRKNLTMEHFSSLMKKYNEAGIPTYSELILGLPGETKDSFCRGICKLLENGQHNSLSVYHCEMLPNSRLSEPDYIQKHQIEVIKVAFNHIHSAINRDEEIQEYSYLVRSTATMSREDWVYSNLFSVCVQCFHSLGLLRCFAMYLHNENKMSYFAFYTALLQFILKESDGRLHDLWSEFERKYSRSLAGDWNYHSEKLGNVTWFFEEGAFLEYISDYEACFREIEPFLFQCGFREDAFYRDLRDYQKFILRMPYDEMTALEIGCRLPEYFEGIAETGSAVMKKQPLSLRKKTVSSFSDIAQYGRQIVWFGRRRGMTVCKPSELICTEMENVDEEPV